MKGVGLHGESSSNNKAIDSSLLSFSKGPMTQLTGFQPPNTSNIMAFGP